jgi:hypothetical protein
LAYLLTVYLLYIKRELADRKAGRELGWFSSGKFSRSSFVALRRERKG